MNINTREPRTLSSPMSPALEPYGLMRNLLRWDPFRDMDFGLETRTAFIPSFDIQETPDAFLFEAELPGIRKEDLDINLTSNRLTVTGKRECDSKREEGNFFTTERSFGCFCRSFSLPEGADASRIKADLENGVLTIHIPKTPEVQPRKVSIS